jgi:GT2 family glycosyltransferase
LGQHDVLHKDALMWMSFVIKNKKSAQLIYSDQDYLSDSNTRISPDFKPDWSLDFFRSSNYIGDLAVFKKDAIQDAMFLSAVRGDIKSSDLALYSMENIAYENIVHIPHALYHARCCHEFISITTAETTKVALQYHLDKTHPGAVAHHFGCGPYGKPWFRVTYPVPEHCPMVSIIIPTRNAKSLVEQCIQSVLGRTAYKNYEIILVDNGSDDPDSLKYFEGLSKIPIIRVMRDDGEFNYSRLNNSAAKMAKGEYLILMNNDIEVINTDWLDEMLSLGSRSGTGAVGAKLLYPDGRVQHAGVIAGLGGVAGHIHRYLESDQAGYQGRAVLTHNLLVVTAACLLVRRSIYEEVQGLNEIDLKVAFNDVDFCLRLHQAGYINVWTPFAKLYHHESATRGLDDNPDKKARFLREWDFMRNTYSSLLHNDPFYNKNCTLNDESFHRSIKTRFSFEDFKKKLTH